MARPQFGLKSIFAVMTLAAVGCVVGPPAVMVARDWLLPPSRTQCPGGLKQIGISFQQYTDVTPRHEAEEERARRWLNSDPPSSADH
jgi:hypothetical protein